MRSVSVMQSFALAADLFPRRSSLAFHQNRPDHEHHFGDPAGLAPNQSLVDKHSRYLDLSHSHPYSDLADNGTDCANFLLNRFTEMWKSQEGLESFCDPGEKDEGERRPMPADRGLTVPATTRDFGPGSVE